MAPADTSSMILLQLAFNSAHSQVVAGALVLTNDFHTPNAVPSSASLPTKIGIDAIKVMALVLSANELSKIGARGWTAVSPIRAKTTMYMTAVNETDIR